MALVYAALILKGDKANAAKAKSGDKRDVTEATVKSRTFAPPVAKDDCGVGAICPSEPPLSAKANITGAKTEIGRKEGIDKPLQVLL